MTEYLPMIVGLQGFRPNLLSIGSDAHVGWQELLPVGGRARRESCWYGGRWTSRAADRWPICPSLVYLAIVGLEAAWRTP